MKKRNTKIISAILSLSIISGTITVSADSNKIFEDSFTDMAKWKATTGTWNVKNGILRQTSTKEGRIQAGELSWRNYTIKADVLIDSFEGKSRGAYVCGRYIDGNNYYSVVLSNKDNGTVELKKKVKGSSTVLASIPYEIKEGNWYNVALKMEDSEIKVSVNDKLLIEEMDSSITNGGIGLISYKSMSSFDNVYALENNTVEINTAPIISGKDIEVEEGYTGDYSSLLNLTAYDEEDGNITNNIKLVSSNVDLSTAGVYQLKYQVTDSDGNKVSKTFTVKVVEKLAEDNSTVVPDVPETPDNSESDSESTEKPEASADSKAEGYGNKAFMEK